MPARGLKVNMVDTVGWRRINTVDLCTTTGSCWPVHFGGFEPPSEKGFGVLYSFVNKSHPGLSFIVIHNDQSKADGFASALRETLLEFKAVLVATQDLSNKLNK
jgi:hypothetical protein